MDDPAKGRSGTWQANPQRWALGFACAVLVLVLIGVCSWLEFPSWTAIFILPIVVGVGGAFWDRPWFKPRTD